MYIYIYIYINRHGPWEIRTFDGRFEASVISNDSILPEYIKYKSLSIYIYIYICIMHIYVYMHIYIYIYICLSQDLTVTRSTRSEDVKFLQNLKITCGDLDKQWEIGEGFEWVTKTSGSTPEGKQNKSKLGMLGGAKASGFFGFSPLQSNQLVPFSQEKRSKTRGAEIQAVAETVAILTEDVLMRFKSARYNK